jgi:hypothetical protein
LDTLGFSPYDPTKVKAEFGSDVPGVKSSERVDYALFCGGVPVMFVEAKLYRENLTNHAPQLSRYFNATQEVTIAAITNGKEWRFFTDLKDKNMMDKDPFLIIDFLNLQPSDPAQFSRFRHDQFQPEALRTLTEESAFLASFKDVVKKSVIECDIEFVKYIVSKSTIQRTLTAKFIECVTPIVKQAVAQTMSDMVVNSLSTSKIDPAHHEESAEIEDQNADEIDPKNPKIVTTAAERKLFSLIQALLPGEPIAPRTTKVITVFYMTKKLLAGYFGTAAIRKGHQ